MAEKIFAKGLRVFEPKETAPEFVLGTIVLTPEDLKDWLTGEGNQYLSEYQGKKQIRLNVTKNKTGRGLTISVDTWKKPEGEFKVKDKGEALPF